MRSGIQKRVYPNAVLQREAQIKQLHRSQKQHLPGLSVLALRSPVPGREARHRLHQVAMRSGGAWDS